jgi:hypothetical protein
MSYQAHCADLNSPSMRIAGFSYRLLVFTQNNKLILNTLLSFTQFMSYGFTLLAQKFTFYHTTIKALSPLNSCLYSTL